MLTILGCNTEKPDVMGPKIETLSAEKGTLIVVLLSGRVSGLEGVALDFECGIEYSTDASFCDDKTTRQRADKKYSEDPFTVTITDVYPGQKYYYRAYYINQLMIYYGEVKDFTFMWEVAQNGSENGYQYIEMGLSVKWATNNVGALSSEEYGDYFAWGETEPYYEAGYAQEDLQAHWKEGKTAGYTWRNYKFRTSGDANYNIKFSKYNTSNDYGLIDNNTTLDPEDDVAHVKWGGTWRMPTEAEQNELRNNCTWTWTILNGVKGYRVTSNKAGYTDRSIFLPAAGFRHGTSLYHVGIVGAYWSSSLYTDNPRHSWHLEFVNEIHVTEDNVRNDGGSVRPVCP